MHSIQFQNTLEDLRGYFDHWAFRTPEGQKWVRQLHFSGQMIYFIGALLIWGLSNKLWIALGFWFLFELVWLIGAGFRPGRWLAQRTIQNWLKPFTGNELENLTLPKILEFSENVLSVRTQEETHAVSWKRVQKIEKSNTNIFIHYGMRTIFVIPGRAFGSEREFEEMSESLRDRLGDRSKAEFPGGGDIIVD